MHAKDTQAWLRMHELELCDGIHSVYNWLPWTFRLALHFWGLCNIYSKQMSMKELDSQPSNETQFPHRWAETGSSKRCWMGGQRSAAAGMGPARQLPRSYAWGRSPAAPQMP